MMATLAMATLAMAMGAMAAAQERARPSPLPASELPTASNPRSSNEPLSIAGLLGRGQRADSAGDLEAALADYTHAIERAPQDPRPYLLRGGVRFKLSEIDGSVRDFDRAIELDPTLEPHLWQRGISLYYAGRFPDCARQFELHRTVNPDDVENAAWHFLCRARIDGSGATAVEAARKLLLPVGEDRRVPMAEIYRLYAGEIDAEAVLARARAVGDFTRDDALFYAHLYLGLFAEVSGDPARAREHFEAATALDRRHYMAAVAKVALGRTSISSPAAP